MPRKRNLGPPELDQQMQLQHQQMLETLQAQHRAFMDTAWQAQMQYLTFCQESGIAAAPLLGRPSPPEPSFHQGGGQYDHNRPRQNHQSSSQQWQNHQSSSQQWQNHQSSSQQWQDHQSSSQQRQSWQQQNPRRPPPPLPQRMNHQNPPRPFIPRSRPHRSVAVWANHEPGHQPRLYCSAKPWKAQLRARTTVPEHDVPIIFRGHTLTALRLREQEPLQPAAPPDCPEPRVCDTCGGTVLNETVHNKSKLHRESVEMDVELICSRIRRDPAFAAAVIGAARDCVESGGFVGTAGDEDEDEDLDENYIEEAEEEGDVQPPPAKQPRVEYQPPADAFGSLEEEVFMREVGQKRRLNNKGEQT